MDYIMITSYETNHVNLYQNWYNVVTTYIKHTKVRCEAYGYQFLREKINEDDAWLMKSSILKL